ncbi:TPA: acyl carrier protein, partial [Klebsiella pneumoniae]|nr:acyl carrier protein [Klebsiella pneumoniae]
LYPVTVPGEEAAKAAPVDIIGPQATSQFDALLAAQRDLQQQAKNDPAWSKQR